MYVCICTKNVRICVHMSQTQTYVQMCIYISNFKAKKYSKKLKIFDF